MGQLCQAGIEAYFDAGIVTAGASGARRWTNAAGMYGRQVAESAMGLLLSVTHLHKRIAQAASWSIWEEIDEQTRWLAGSTVAVVGAGGIGHHPVGDAGTVRGRGPRRQPQRTAGRGRA